MIRVVGNDGAYNKQGGKMPETKIYRIVFHTKEDKERFKEVKQIIKLIIAPEMVKIFDPPDNGKKVIFFAATLTQKRKIERELKNARIEITISSHIAPC
jgi:hypothetical protein